jgi:hypothetical protein
MRGSELQVRLPVSTGFEVSSSLRDMEKQLENQRTLPWRRKQFAADVIRVRAMAGRVIYAVEQAVAAGEPSAEFEISRQDAWFMREVFSARNLGEQVHAVDAVLSPRRSWPPLDKTYPAFRDRPTSTKSSIYIMPVRYYAWFRAAADDGDASPRNS